jgi:ribosomal protein L20
MKAMAAREAKHQFGRLIDTARAEPVVVERHVVVLAVEEFERIKAIVEKAIAAGAKKKTTG